MKLNTGVNFKNCANSKRKNYRRLRRESRTILRLGWGGKEKLNGQMPLVTTTSSRMPKMKLNARAKRRFVSANDKLRRLLGIRSASKEKDLMKSRSRQKMS